MIFIVTACGSGAEAKDSLPAPESVGDPAAGEAIFNTEHREAPACSMCHLVAGESNGYAPSLEGVAGRALNRIEGMDAVDYLRQSIVEPSAYDADPEGTTRMYEHFGETLSEAEIDH